MQNHLFRGGIPKERIYKMLIESPEFRDMERFSNKFLYTNKKILENYSKRWVKDPFHQWSRQWEYPYVFNRVESIIKDRKQVRILDAGSGITFFPYYIKSLYSFIDIDCTDYDVALETIYQQVNAQGEHTVNFSCSDLGELPYQDNWFDAVYCISVLEHTDKKEKIVEEFHRILQPGGKLVITFDVSLDGTRDISLGDSVAFLNVLTKKFDVMEDISFDLESQASMVDIFTTRTAREINPDLLPWKLPLFVYRIKSLIEKKQLGTWPPLLTVFCLSLTNRPN